MTRLTHRLTHPMPEPSTSCDRVHVVAVGARACTACAHGPERVRQQQTPPHVDPKAGWLL